jgi:tryptophanyl-tRNA synthetase
MLNWVLNNVTPFSLMARAHSFKDSQDKSLKKIENLFHGLHKQIAHDELFEKKYDLHNGSDYIFEQIKNDILPKIYAEKLNLGSLNM